MVFGTFDIIHPSHLRFLIEARKAANCEDCELVVVLARDNSIKRIKGRKPIFNEQQRLKLLSGLRVIDYVRLGNEGKEYYNIILEVNPDFIVLGYDQVHHEKALLNFITKNNLNIEVCKLPKFESGDLTSSSDVREKVLEMINEKNKE